MPRRHDSTKINAAVASAPANAATGSSEGLAPTSRIAMAQAAAPVLMPMMSGETRGLSTSDWKSAPETARHAPASSATTTRGKRRELTTKSNSPPRSHSAVASARPAGTGKSPTTRPVTIRATAANAAPAPSHTTRHRMRADSAPHRSLAVAPPDRRGRRNTTTRTARAAASTARGVADGGGRPAITAREVAGGGGRPAITVRPAGYGAPGGRGTAPPRLR